MRTAKHYTIRKRKLARRWELHIRDPKGLGAWIYGGLYKTFDEAIAALDNWGLKPSQADLDKQALIKKNLEILKRGMPKIITNA